MGYSKTIDKLPQGSKPIRDNDMELYDPVKNKSKLNVGLEMYVIPSTGIGVEVYILTEDTNIDELNRFRLDNRVFVNNSKKLQFDLFDM